MLAGEYIEQAEYPNAQFIQLCAIWVRVFVLSKERERIGDSVSAFIIIIIVLFLLECAEWAFAGSFPTGGRQISSAWRWVSLLGS